MKLRDFPILFVLAVSALAGSRQTAAQPPIANCSQGQLDEWGAIWNTSLGVDGRDPFFEDISVVGADGNIDNPRATDGLHDWTPVDGYKTKLCGRLHRFTNHCPGRRFVFDECDWNLHVVPVKPHGSVVARTRELSPRSKIGSCRATDTNGAAAAFYDCVETEVTPHGTLPPFGNWLGNEVSTGLPPGWKEVCNYGPWVTDSGHGHQPEIHPAQLRWLRDGASRSFTLFLVQDASSRFAARRHFIHQRRPVDWAAWAQTPLHGEFRVAFQTKGAAGSRLVIKELHAREVRPGGGTTPCSTTSGAPCELSDGASLAVRVENLLDPPTKIAVRFDEVCRRSDGVLQGYVRIAAGVGSPDCGREGYLVLQVVDESPVSEGAPPVTAHGGPGLEVIGPAVTDAGPVSRVASLRSQPPPAQPSPPPYMLTLAVVRDAPHALESVTGPEGPIWTLLAGEASRGFAVTRRPPAPPIPLKRVREWELVVDAHYGGSPAADHLDEVLQEGNESEIQRAWAKLTGGSRPFSLASEWQAIAASDLTAPGRAVTVIDATKPGGAGRRPSPDAVYLESMEPGSGRFGIKARFPSTPPGAVYRLDLTAVLRDAAGFESRLLLAIWSHGLAAPKSPRPLIEVLLQDPGPPATTWDALLKAAAQKGRGDREASSLARQVLFSAESFASDALVTVLELRSLMESTEHLRRVLGR